MSRIIFCLTADWEGEHFNDLNDFKGIRKHIGLDIPMTHFITASYFTKKLNNPAEKILSAITKDDEIALHVHCLRSLIKKANVPFIDKPDFFEPLTPTLRAVVNLLPKFMQPATTGRGVPISIYPPDDILKIIKTSVELLKKNLNASKISSFRAGGWMASDAVLQALEKLDFECDSSSAPPEILSQGYDLHNTGNMHDEHNFDNGIFTKFIIKLWGHEKQSEYFISNELSLKNCPDSHIKKTTQPYSINSLMEMPNNASMSDYASSSTTMTLVNKGIEEIENGRQKPYFINLGLHQEGNINHKLPIIDFFDSLSEKQRKYIDFMTVIDASKIARKFL